MIEAQGPDPTRLEQQAILAAEAYKASLKYVRYALSGLALVTVATFVAQYNSRSGNWLDARLRLAQTALQSRFWQRSILSLNPKERLAQSWAEYHGLRTEEDIRERIKRLEADREDKLLRIQLPIVVQELDINDLGLFSGLSSMALTIFLSFAVARHSEALYLALWRVKELWRAEGCPDDPNSRSNAVYHDLAMAEIFYSPPTIARWRPSRAWPIRIVIVIPLCVQFWVLYDSLNFLRVGLILQPRSASLSLLAQFWAVACSSAFVVLSLIYGRANDRGFQGTFSSINHRLSKMPQPPWSEWVELPTRRKILRKKAPAPEALRAESNEQAVFNSASLEAASHHIPPPSTGQSALPPSAEA